MPITLRLARIPEAPHLYPGAGDHAHAREHQRHPSASHRPVVQAHREERRVDYIMVAEQTKEYGMIDQIIEKHV